MKKFIPEHVTYTQHPIPMIGRVWVFPEVVYTKDAEGELGISFIELEKLQLSVANAICGEEQQLKSIEFDFLLNITKTTQSEIAEFLKCHVSSIGKWRQKENVPQLESLVLKEIFWTKLFGNKVSYEQSLFGRQRLALMSNAAIEKKVVAPVHKKAA